VVSSTPQLHFTPRKDPVPILQEAGWAPRPVWMGAENLVPTRIRFRIVQAIVCHYTELATQPTQGVLYGIKIFTNMRDCSEEVKTGHHIGSTNEQT